MTAAKYREVYGLEYEGKHRKRLYRVSRIIKYNGPIVISEVYGYEEAIRLCSNCYNWDINEVSERKLNKYTLLI